MIPFVHLCKYIMLSDVGPCSWCASPLARNGRIGPRTKAGEVARLCDNCAIGYALRQGVTFKQKIKEYCVSVPGADLPNAMISWENLLLLGSWTSAVVILHRNSSDSLHDLVETVQSNLEDIAVATINVDVYNPTDSVGAFFFPSPPPVGLSTVLLIGGISRHDWRPDDGIEFEQWLLDCDSLIRDNFLDNRLTTDEWLDILSKVDDFCDISFDDMVVGETEIGGGGYANVYKGRWKGEGHAFCLALKKFTLSRKDASLTRVLVASIERELEAYRNVMCSSPCALKIHGACAHLPSDEPDACLVYIVMELADGSFADRDRKLSKLQKVDIMNVAFTVAHGLHTLHRLEYAHRDVKLANILYRDVEKKHHDNQLPKFEVFLADYGLTKQVTPTMEPSPFPLSTIVKVSIHWQWYRALKRICWTMCLLMFMRWAFCCSVSAIQIAYRGRRLWPIFRASRRKLLRSELLT